MIVKIVQINMVDYGSTGNIMLSIAEYIRKNGDECETFSMRWKNQKKRAGHTYFGYYIENVLHQVLGRIFGLGGFFSVFGTFSLIKKIK